jgi:hypothetical protein
MAECVNSHNYQSLAERTSSTAGAEGINKCRERMKSVAVSNQIRKIAGLSEVFGREADILKRAVFYGCEESAGLLPDGEECLISPVDEMNDASVRLLHAGLGLLTEACEFIDSLMANILYGIDLDEINMQVEVGDVFWYGAEAMNAMGPVAMDAILEQNILKLKSRYPHKFDEVCAVDRDEETERRVVEG